MFLEEKATPFRPCDHGPDRQRLLDAADYIERHGWCRNALKKEDGSVCVLGALLEANGIDLGEVSRRLAKYIQSRSLLPGYELVCPETLAVTIIEAWNDIVAGSADEVIALLRNAAL